jgi:hypothetical protein
MKIPGFGCALSICGAAALLGGCNVSQPPIAAPVPMSQNGPAMNPSMRKSTPALWYFTNSSKSTIDAYTLPGLKFAYTLTGLSSPTDMCTIGSRSFWVVNAGASDLLEYDYHGTRPMKTLTESVSRGIPQGCSVDPASGNLATAIFFTNDVVVWKGGTGSPVVYKTPLSLADYVGYDGSGNLFAIGAKGFNYALAELPKGETKFWDMTMDQKIAFPGNIQWDGKYLAVDDLPLHGHHTVIYQFSCSRTTCKEEGRTPLMMGGGDCTDGWIDQAIFVCNDLVWHYPAGGRPFKALTGASAGNGNVIVN